MSPVNDTESHEDSYYLGWAECLLYAQAHADVEGGSQTLSVHLPDTVLGTWGEDAIPFNTDKLDKALYELNDECMCSCWRYKADLGVIQGWTNFRGETVPPFICPQIIIEVGGSEGYHGLPNWDNEQEETK